MKRSLLILQKLLIKSIWQKINKLKPSMKINCGHKQFGQKLRIDTDENKKIIKDNDG